MAAPGAELGNLSAALENPEAASAASVIALQQRYGNRAVRRLLQREGEAPTTTASASSFDLETPRGLWKHLNRLYHPDKARTPDEIPWRTELMAKINNARNDLAALKRLAAEGAAHASGTAPTTTTAPTTELSDAVVTVPSDEGGAQAPVSQDLVQNAAPLALELATPNEATTDTGNEPPGAEEEDLTPDRPVWENNALRMQTLGHNRKVLPVLKKYMAERNESNRYNLYFDTSTNTKALYRKYFTGGAPQQVPLRSTLQQKLDELAQAQDWERMAPFVDQARAQNQEFINTNILPDFEQTPEYAKFKVTSRDRPVLARLGRTVTSATRGAVGGQAGRQAAVTRRAVAVLDQAIDRQTRYFVGSMERLNATGLPNEPRALDQIFTAGQLRHANVVRAFTRRYAADKAFRPDRYGAFFGRLRAFTKLWVQYKALLKK